MSSRILIVEDEQDLLTALAYSLKKEGYETLTASTGTEAVRLATGRLKPDVILLDLMLPDGSGYDLITEIRKFSGIPIIVISARILGEDKVRALDMGADDYVTKPFWVNELNARIRAILRRQNTSKPPAELLFIGELQVDFSAREVWRGEQLVQLTPTEFGLLQFFAKRPKQALSRDEIIDAVFRNPSSASEALQTHISRLRKKLGPTGKHISTVWGLGYRFDPPEIA